MSFSRENTVELIAKDSSKMSYVKETDEKNNRRLYFKVQNLIKNVKIQKYTKVGQEIFSEGISFFGGITGKNALQLEKIRNVKLRIELLQSKRITLKNQYNPEDIMSDLYVCAISELGGNFTPEMKSIYDELKLEYADKNITEESVYKLACKKIEDSQSYLPILHKEKTKGIFADTRVQIEFYKLENSKLENEIILERGKSQFETFSSDNEALKRIIPVNVKNSNYNNQTKSKL